MAKKTKDLIYYEATGRRKTAVARVRLYLKPKEKIKLGDVFVNDKPIDEIYLPYQVDYALTPLKITDNLKRFAISVKVKGGGKNGQLEAIAHALSKALVEVDIGYKPKLRKEGFITRDPRAKERRKVGTGGKARREKQSPKR